MYLYFISLIIIGEEESDFLIMMVEINIDAAEYALMAQAQQVWALLNISNHFL